MLFIENIGQGGFRYLSDEIFVVDDWNKVQLRFSDDRSQEVLGRICYREAPADDNRFSVIDSFYSPQTSNW